MGCHKFLDQSPLLVERQPLAGALLGGRVYICKGAPSRTRADSLLRAANEAQHFLSSSPAFVGSKQLGDA